MNEPVYLSVDTIKNTRVFDNTGVQIGQIDDLLIDRETNKIACAVLSFGHHLMGIGNKYLAIPLFKAMSSSFSLLIIRLY